VGDSYLEIPAFPPRGFRLVLRWRPLTQQTALQLIGGSSEPCFALASSNLLDWVILGEIRSVASEFELVDTAAPRHGYRFYRAQTIPPPPVSSIKTSGNTADNSLAGTHGECAPAGRSSTSSARQ